MDSLSLLHEEQKVRAYFFVTINIPQRKVLKKNSWGKHMCSGIAQLRSQGCGSGCFSRAGSGSDFFLKVGSGSNIFFVASNPLVKGKKAVSNRDINPIRTGGGGGWKT